MTMISVKEEINYVTLSHCPRVLLRKETQIKCSRLPVFKGLDWGTEKTKMARVHRFLKVRELHRALKTQRVPLETSAECSLVQEVRKTPRLGKEQPKRSKQKNIWKWQRVGIVHILIRVENLIFQGHQVKYSKG